jgi:hypothetical protein
MSEQQHDVSDDVSECSSSCGSYDSDDDSYHSDGHSSEYSCDSDAPDPFPGVYHDRDELLAHYREHMTMLPKVVKEGKCVVVLMRQDDVRFAHVIYSSSPLSCSLLYLLLTMLLIDLSKHRTCARASIPCNALVVS